MTPRDYMDRIAELIAAERDEEALQLADTVGRDITPRMSAEEFLRVAAMLESAELAVSVTRASQANRSEREALIEADRV
jgi:hypothetical protein